MICGDVVVRHQLYRRVSIFRDAIERVTCLHHVVNKNDGLDTGIDAGADRLLPGVHTGQIEIAAVGVSNSPVIVSVTLAGEGRDELRDHIESRQTLTQ